MSKPTSRLLRTSWQFCVDTSSLIFIKNPDEDFVISVSIPARSVTLLAMVQVAAVLHVTIVPSPCCVCRKCGSSSLTCSLRGGRTATDTWAPRPARPATAGTQFNTNLWRRRAREQRRPAPTAGVSLKADKVLMERIKCK